MKNALRPFAKSVLKSFGLIVAASATDGATQKKMFGLGNTALMISNKKVKDIMKKVNMLEKLVFL